ncbi:MAG: carbohydrate ABC transporter permease [Marinosulfonomonas sp.]
MTDNASKAVFSQNSDPDTPDETGWRLSASQRQAVFGYALLLGPFLIYGYFMLIPLIRTAYFSLTSWNGVTAEKTFVGLDNFVRMAFDPLFWGALTNTAIWVIGGTIFELAIALLLAMLVWNRPRGFMIYRTIFFMPMVLPAVVVGVVWIWIYSPLFGILNRGLKTVGLESWALGWLGDPGIALYSVLAASIWAHVGLSFVIFVAALQNVDEELLDAAKIDGATAWERFYFVVVPQLSNAITLVAVLLLVHGLNGFDLIWVMTHGGPNDSTQILATYAYETAFVQNEAGYGSAIALVLAAIALFVSVATVNMRERTAAGQSS